MDKEPFWLLTEKGAICYICGHVEPDTARLPEHCPRCQTEITIVKDTRTRMVAAA